ncbi:methyl-accepting chemotaxis protein [Ectothiorhodospira mobilis]|uniref:Methyl-accepting chemotaxis protein n=1 Tax=Ectothiorhodospira mobilis TaxID=195064 RepID=A0A1I4SCV0_ECTMO|nr:methyl-accepting chemotaxis protein [Ectothiorhodospira mobilis]SFM62140.1 methyl-accepting chemotaxis protein [Ectothiorhodospira mobilis]
MKILTRLTIGATVLAGLAVLLSAGVTGLLAQRGASQVIEHGIQQQFGAVASGRRARLEDEMADMRHLLETLAHGRMVQDAVWGFKEPYVSYRYEVASEPTQTLRGQMASWYRETYAPLYQERTHGEDLDPRPWVEAMSHEALLLQRYYMADNPHPPAQLEALVDRGDATIYGQQHRRYHASFRDTAQRWGFNDLMLVDAASQAVIYTVDKGPVFGTSLRNGPFADTHLGRLVASMAEDRETDRFRMSGFQAFPGRFGRQVVFMAVPVFHAAYSPDRAVGILIAEIPASRFTELMTDGGAWRQAGLGETGEAYLVDGEGRMVTEPRPMLEQGEAFLQKMRAAGRGGLWLASAQRLGRVSGHLHLDNAAVRAALSGDSGMGIGEDYLGRTMYMAWAPVELGDHRLALITQQDPEEIRAPLERMRRDVALGALLAVALLSLAAAVASYGFARMISRPLQDLAGAITDAAASRDLGRRFSTGRRDEIGRIAEALDGFFSKLEQIIREMVRLSGRAAEAADSNAGTARSCLDSVHGQHEALDVINREADALETATRRIVERMDRASASAQSASERAADGRRQVDDVARLMDRLAQQVRESGSHLHGLQKAVGDIDSVLGTIQKVADQTNLLALNAAIEAARAGPQGRGFAVVAEQVRSLAGETHKATTRIHDMVERLNTNMTEVVEAMELERGTAEQCVSRTGEAVEALGAIGEVVETIQGITGEVAGETETQMGNTESMRHKLDQLVEEANQTEQAMRRLAGAADEQKDMAAELARHTGQFRVQ